MKLLSSSGDALTPASLFVHVSITKLHEMVGYGDFSSLKSTFYEISKVLFIKQSVSHFVLVDH